MTPSAPHRRRWRRWAWALGLLSAVVVVAALLAVDLRRADRALHQARATAPGLAQALAAGDEAKARQLLESVREQTSVAERSTGGPLWDVAVHLPWVGRTLETTRSVSRTSDQVVRGVASPLLDVLHEVRAAQSRAAGRVDLASVSAAQPRLESALLRARHEVRSLDGAPVALVWPAVADARRDLLRHLTDLTEVLSSLVEGARVLPSMLGQDGPRLYLLAFQNNAEARGTGGLLGGFAILRVDHGRASVVHVGSDRELDGFPAPRLDLGPEFQSLYGGDMGAWQNANLSGHFPYAARLWTDMWRRHTGQRLDGVLGTDPTALARILAVTGPVAVPGVAPVTADDVVARTESTAYQQFDDSDIKRKGYLVSVGQAVLAKLLGPESPGLVNLVRPLLDAAESRSVMVYSARPEEERWLSSTPLGGEVPDASGPFAFVTVNNTAGNKIDYYLDRTVRYELGACAGGRRASTLTTALRVDVPASPLPAVVVGRLDRKHRPARSTSLLVSAYLPEGATLTRAEVDGKQVAVFPGYERGHPVFVLRLELLARRQTVITLSLSEPASSRAPVVLEQSLARRQVTSVRAEGCP